MESFVDSKLLDFSDPSQLTFRGGEIGGRGPGGEAHFITCPCYKITATQFRMFGSSKIATKSVQKLLPEYIRNTLRESKFPKFSGGACPQTPLGRLWLYAHSLTVVIVHSQRSEPPHFCYLFSALTFRINRTLGVSRYNTA